MKHMLAAVLVGAAALGASAACRSEPSGPGPGGGGTVTATVNDPAGDQFGTDSIQPDLIKLTVTRDSAGISVAIDFASDVISPLTDTLNGIIGYVDFDTDQDSTTGVGAATDFFRASGSTGLGAEFLLDFTFYNADSVFVLDTAGNPTGMVQPSFSGKRISFRIPRALLGSDDGFMNVAAVVGSISEATDLAPDAGHLQVGGVGAVASYQPSASPSAGLRATRRRWADRAPVKWDLHD